MLDGDAGSGNGVAMLKRKIQAVPCFGLLPLSFVRRFEPRTREPGSRQVGCVRSLDELLQCRKLYRD